MIDLRGQRFGRLVAMDPTDGRYRGTVVVWRCKCDCGQEKLVPASLLRGGLVKSCGCLQDQIRRKDITGETRGHLTAIRPTDDRRNGKTVWEWRCQCGRAVYKPPGMVRDGMSTMCQSCADVLKVRQARARGERIERDAEGRSVKQVEAIRAGKPTVQNTSGVRGVSWHPRLKKWQVRVYVRGEVKHVGYYKDLEKAKIARSRAVEEIYGDT